MQMTGEERIAAPRATVWQALNDPDILRQCIPGCQSLEQEADGRLRATVEIRIGPIGARFNGAVSFSEVHAPNGYRITGQGQGGTVGHARGGAKVRLADEDGDTRLSYVVEAEVGGRLAQLGGPIIDATARQLAGKFFQRLNAVVSGEVASAPASATDMPARAMPAPRAAAFAAPWGWIIALLLAIAAGFGIGRSGIADLWAVAVALLVLVTAIAAFEAGRRGGGR